MLNLFKWVYRKGEEKAALQIIAIIQRYAQNDGLDASAQTELMKLANGIRASYFKGEK